MTPEEELKLISDLLDENFVPKFNGTAEYSVYGRVALLAEKLKIHIEHLTWVNSNQTLTNKD